MITSNILFHPDSVRMMNEIMTLNKYCDSHYEPEIDKENDRFFGTHIREVVKTVKDCFRK